MRKTAITEVEKPETAVVEENRKEKNKHGEKYGKSAGIQKKEYLRFFALKVLWNFPGRVKKPSCPCGETREKRENAA